MNRPVRPVLLIEDSDNDILLFRRALAQTHSDLPLEIIRDGQAASDRLKEPPRPSLHPDTGFPRRPSPTDSSRSR